MACVFDAGGGGSPSPADVEAMKKGYAALPEVSSSSSSNPGSKGVNDGVAEVEEDELELGLSLGTKAAAIGGGGRGGAPWGEYCRILTAEDLPLMGSRVASPLSSSSSVSSSSPTMSGARTSDVATKRVAGGGSNGVVGSANSPSQVVVGWPPIRTYRINNLANQCKDNTSSNAAVTSTSKNTQDNKNQKTERNFCSQDTEQIGRVPGNSPFVKVNMDGDPIGRKVDISAHLSYEALALSLESMFCKLRSTFGASSGGQRTSKLLDGSSGFALTYEDKDGDWMLVGDVPWGMFLSTVKRLRIMRTCNANGLEPRSNSSHAAVA